MDLTNLRFLFEDSIFLRMFIHVPYLQIAPLPLSAQVHHSPGRLVGSEAERPALGWAAVDGAELRDVAEHATQRYGKSFGT